MYCITYADVNRLALGVVLVVVVSWRGDVLLGQGTESLTCDAIGRDPQKYVGKPVVLFGSVAGVSIRTEVGKTGVTGETFRSWVCKAKDGQAVPGGDFGVRQSDSTWSAAAANADMFKQLFRLSGVVKGVDKVTVTGSSIPFLEKVKIELATEGK